MTASLIPANIDWPVLVREHGGDHNFFSRLACRDSGQTYAVGVSLRLSPKSPANDANIISMEVA